MKPNFINLNGKYLLDVAYIEPKVDNTKSKYSCEYYVQAHRSKDDSFQFLFERHEVKINHRKPRKLMDRIMHDLGDVLYPIVCKASNTMELLEISNYSEVLDRWGTKADELLSKYYTVAFEQYINECRKGINTESCFRTSLLNDTFFNLFFRDIYTPLIENEYYISRWGNFPRKGMQREMLCAQDTIKESSITVKGEALQINSSMNGTLVANYSLGDRGEIISIIAELESQQKNKLYKKDIHVEFELSKK